MEQEKKLAALILWQQTKRQTANAEEEKRQWKQEARKSRKVKRKQEMQLLPKHIHDITTLTESTL